MLPRKSRAGAFLLLLLASNLLTTLARAEDASELARGRAVAERACAARHQVLRAQQPPALPGVQPPSFYHIAATLDVRSLRRIITTTHWDEKTIPMTMPNQGGDCQYPQPAGGLPLRIRP
jgi:hypothetical protein